MNEKDRLDIIEQLAQKWTKQKTFQDLALYYYESQTDFLSSLTESELSKISEEVV